MEPNIANSLFLIEAKPRHMAHGCRTNYKPQIKFCSIPHGWVSITLLHLLLHGLGLYPWEGWGNLTVRDEIKKNTQISIPFQSLAQ